MMKTKHGVVLLLSLVVTLLVNALFIVAVFRSADPLLPVFYFCCLPFYVFLYRWRRLRRTRHRDVMLRSGLGHAALGFGMLLSVLFVYGFARHVPLHRALAAWLFSALPLAYCYYRVIVLHLELEEQQEEEALPLRGGGAVQQAAGDGGGAVGGLI